MTVRVSHHNDCSRVLTQILQRIQQLQGFPLRHKSGQDRHTYVFQAFRCLKMKMLLWHLREQHFQQTMLHSPATAGFLSAWQPLSQRRLLRRMVRRRAFKRNRCQILQPAVKRRSRSGAAACPGDVLVAAPGGVQHLGILTVGCQPEQASALAARRLCA